MVKMFIVSFLSYSSNKNTNMMIGIVDNIWMFTVIACFFVLTAGVGSAFLVMTYIMLFYVGYDV